MYVVAEPTVSLPFQVVDAAKPKEFFEQVRAVFSIMNYILIYVLG